MTTTANKWKIGFWIYFSISIIIIFYLFFKTMNNEVGFTFLKIDKKQTESDLGVLVNSINKTDFSKKEIIEKVLNNNFQGKSSMGKDRIDLEKIILIFENDSLTNIEYKDL